jgi:hypothetical protein
MKLAWVLASLFFHACVFQTTKSNLMFCFIQ